MVRSESLRLSFMAWSESLRYICCSAVDRVSWYWVNLCAMIHDVEWISALGIMARSKSLRRVSRREVNLHQVSWVEWIFAAGSWSGVNLCAGFLCTERNSAATFMPWSKLLCCGWWRRITLNIRKCTWIFYKIVFTLKIWSHGILFRATKKNFKKY